MIPSIGPVAKEIVEYTASFQEDISGTKCNVHPAQVVPHSLASPNAENNSLRMKQLEMWYMQYQQERFRGSLQRYQVICQKLNSYIDSNHQNYKQWFVPQPHAAGWF